MTTELTTASARKSILQTVANGYDMEPAAFEATLRATVVPKSCSKEQFAAFLLVANEYGLNPLTKEIYAFPSNGGIQPIVGIDGWISMANRHPQYDGLTTIDIIEDGGVVAITCKVYRKDRSHPIEVTEYMSECQGSSVPWKKWPIRMLRHKATIQGLRVAFGFSGIMDEDEYERMKNITPTPPPSSPTTKVPAGLDDISEAVDAVLEDTIAAQETGGEVEMAPIIPDYDDLAEELNKHIGLIATLKAEKAVNMYISHTAKEFRAKVQECAPELDDALMTAATDKIAELSLQ